MGIKRTFSGIFKCLRRMEPYDQKDIPEFGVVVKRISCYCKIMRLRIRVVYRIQRPALCQARMKHCRYLPFAAHNKSHLSASPGTGSKVECCEN